MIIIMKDLKAMIIVMIRSIERNIIKIKLIRRLTRTKVAVKVGSMQAIGVNK